MEFQREKLTPELFAEMLPHFVDHYTEIGNTPDIPMSPDYETYQRTEDAGFLRLFTARNDGKLCGYAVFFVKENPHQQRSLQALEDVLYMSKSERRGSMGYKFIRWCDNQLEQDGVDIIYQHVTHHLDFGRLLERLGYEAIETVYARRVK